MSSCFSGYFWSRKRFASFHMYTDILRLDFVCWAQDQLFFSYRVELRYSLVKVWFYWEIETLLLGISVFSDESSSTTMVSCHILFSISENLWMESEYLKDCCLYSIVNWCGQSLSCLLVGDGDCCFLDESSSFSLICESKDQTQWFC